MQAGVPQGSVLSPTLFNMYINDTLQTICAHLALFADDACLYATECKQGYVIRKLQHGLNSMAEWSKHWNVKINEDKTQAICICLQNHNITHLSCTETSFNSPIFQIKLELHVFLEANGEP
jgi:hypothetical protein